MHLGVVKIHVSRILRHQTREAFILLAGGAHWVTRGLRAITNHTLQCPIYHLLIALTQRWAMWNTRMRNLAPSEHSPTPIAFNIDRAEALSIALQQPQAHFASAGVRPNWSPNDASFDLVPDAYQKIYITNSSGVPAASGGVALGNSSVTLAGMLEEDILIASKRLMKALLLRNAIQRSRCTRFRTARRKCSRRTTASFRLMSGRWRWRWRRSRRSSGRASRRRKASVLELPSEPGAQSSSTALSSRRSSARRRPRRSSTSPPPSASSGVSRSAWGGVIQIYEQQAGRRAAHERLTLDAGLPPSPSTWRIFASWRATRPTARWK